MIVSEIGLNHRGDEATAYRMLKKLVKTGVDAITFQIPAPEHYDGSKPWRKQPLSKKFYKDAISFVHKNNKFIGFAIADKGLVSFLNHCGSDFWKTLSGDISNDGLHAELQKTEKVTFVSTGLADENQIQRISKGLRNIRVIHTRLSPRVEDANLSAISKLKDLTNKKVAFGLHCPDVHVLYLSLAFNPSDIFFYVKENSSENYADDGHAIIIDKVDEVVKRLKHLKKAID